MFSSFFLPLAIAIALIDLPAGSAVRPVAGWWLGTAVVVAVGLVAYQSRMSCPTRVRVVGEGIILRPETRRAQLWAWDRLSPPRMGGFQRFWGIYSIGLWTGKNLVDISNLSPAQARAVLRSSHRPEWKLDPIVSKKLRLGTQS